MSVEDAIANNAAQLARRGPALSFAYQAFVVELRDGRVLLGGLGCMGLGEMWVVEQPRHRDYPGYAEALARQEQRA